MGNHAGLTEKPGNWFGSADLPTYSANKNALNKGRPCSGIQKKADALQPIRDKIRPETFEILKQLPYLVNNRGKQRLWMAGKATGCAD
jgi:hypothetical protein